MPNATAATFSNGVVIPEYVYILFQMTFACITPALIVGAFAERMKFSAVLLFVVLWVTFVYFPIAHMVWYWAGPDAIADAVKAVAAAGRMLPPRRRHEAKLDAVKADAGHALLSGARSTSPAAPSSTSMPASRVSSAASHRQAHRLRQGPDASPLADHDDDRRLAALGRLVRLQRRLQPRGQWRRGAGHAINTFVATAAAALVLAVRRMGRQGQAVDARRGLGRRRRPRCGHPGRRLRRSDGRDRPRPRRRRRLLLLLLAR
jgi:hypothetical protein